MVSATSDPLAPIRAICVAFPEVTERLSHGAPTWFAGPSAFATLWADGHHDLAFPHLCLAAPPGAQAELIAADPVRFFRPPYVGPRGWVGIRLTGRLDWSELAELCQDAYRTVARKRMISKLDRPDPGNTANLPG